MGENSRPYSGGQKSAVAVSAGAVPSGGPETSPPSPGGPWRLLGTLGIAGSKLCLCHHVAFSSLCVVSPCSSLVRTFVRGCRAHLNEDDIFLRALTYFHLQRPSFQMRSRSQILSGRIFRGATTKPTTVHPLVPQNLTPAHAQNTFTPSQHPPKASQLEHQL